MTRNYTEEERKLLTAIYPIFIENGPKSTTMDLVAKRLGMSKRTLYEIFENKSEMIKGALALNAEVHQKESQKIMSSAPNVMEALIKIFDFHRRDLEGMSLKFFKDMDRLYPELRDDYEQRHEAVYESLEQVFRQGVEEGVFRDAVNFRILSRMLELQAESLKRMENLFPPEITLVEIFDTMTISFLRSIASTEGHRLIDSYIQQRKLPSTPKRKTAAQS